MRLGGRDFNHGTAGIDQGPAGTACDNQSLDLLGQCFGRQAGALLHQLGFIVIEGNPGGFFDEIHQLGAIEHRHALARIEDKRNAGFDKLRGMLNHAVLAIR